MAYASDAELVGLIGDIYDAVIDKGLWPGALERFRVHFGFRTAVLSAIDRVRGVAFMQLAANVPQHLIASLPSFGLEPLEVWGGAARFDAFPLEEPMITSHFTDVAYWQTLRFYKEWAEPQGLVDQVGMVLIRDRLALSALGLAIDAARPPITDADLDGIRLVAPHLSRAVRISGLLDSALSAVSTFQAALEATAAGVVLVKDDMSIVHANRAAMAMLEAGDPVRGVAGHLALREEFVPGQLAAAVAAASREADMGRRGIGIPSRLRDGTPISINVMPLEARSSRLDVGVDANAAIFIGDAAAPLHMPDDAMRLLYDLTPAEQRVFELVVEGKSTEATASALGVATSTVRTQLLSVFSKTGRHSRSDLRLLARDIRLPN